MKKSLLSLLGVFLCFTLSHAQTRPAAPTNDADPALWVTKDADTTIYLFGTAHLLDPKVVWFDDAIKEAFDQSSELIIEAELSTGAAAQTAMLKFAVDPDGPPLLEKLPKELAERYRRQMAAFGVPAAAFDQFKPWFAAMSLSALQLVKSGMKPESGAEEVLLAAAKASKKTVGALETEEQQLGFFDSLDEASQITFLSITLDELSEGPALIDEQMTLWAKGDASGLGELMNEGLSELPQLGKVLLEDRNTRWAQWIAERLRRPGTVFVAVGAGHLAGNQSVQSKLTDRGIRSERIEY